MKLYYYCEQVGAVYTEKERLDSKFMMTMKRVGYFKNRREAEDYVRSIHPWDASCIRNEKRI